MKGLVFPLQNFTILRASEAKFDCNLLWMNTYDCSIFWLEVKSEAIQEVILFYTTLYYFFGKSRF